MKKRTLFTLPILLTLWLTATAWAAEVAPASEGQTEATTTLIPELGLDRVVNWLLTLWVDQSPNPEVNGGEMPEAFIQGVGPYIVPVGSPAPQAAPTDQLAAEGESGSEDP